MQRYTVYFIWKLLYIFQVVLPPVIRSANNCIYSGVAAYIYATTPPNEPYKYILNHLNNCNFSKAQIVYSLMMVFYTKTCSSFLM